MPSPRPPLATLPLFPQRVPCPPGACICGHVALVESRQGDQRILLLTREEEAKLAEEARRKAEEEAKRKAEEEAKQRAAEEAQRPAAAPAAVEAPVEAAPVVDVELPVVAAPVAEERKKDEPRRPDKARNDDADRRGFSRPVRAQQGIEIPRFNLQVDSPQCLNPAGVGFFELF